jgi:succinate dehydrogenase / fumarate reductase, membrane anchor subunit
MSQGSSAGRGSRHWRAQRLGALLLIPLSIWFVAALILLPDYSFDTMHAWAATPWRAALLGLLVLLVTWHSRLGVLVLIVAWHSKLGVYEVIADYVPAPGAHAWLQFLNTWLHVAAGAAGAFAVASIAFKG